MKFISQNLRATGLPKALKESSENQLVQRLTGGMYSSIDPSDIPEECFTRLVNTRNRYDYSERRVGYSLIDATKPDSDPVIGLILSRNVNEELNIYRVTNNAIHRLGVSTWLPVFSGDIGDKISATTVFDTIVIADGEHKLIYIVNGTYVDVADAPIAKFVTGFDNRVVIGYTHESDGSIRLAWSGEYKPGNPTALQTFDFSINESSGQEPLVESPSSVGDHVRYILGMSSNMVVLRNRSIVLATKQPAASAPFRFYTAIPEIGTDCSYAPQLTRNGLCFPDTLTRSIYVYSPGGSIERIGLPIELELFNVLGKTVNPIDAFSAFDQRFNEYHLCVPEGGTLKKWVYNFDTKAFSYDESAFLDNMKSIMCIGGAIDIGLTIGELTGEIGDLPGTIGELIGSRQDDTILYIGMNDGEVAIEAESVDLDDTEPYITYWESRDNTVPPDFAAEISKLLFEYKSTDAPTLSIEYSVDSGANWIAFKASATYGTGLSEAIIAYKNIFGRRLRWRIQCTAGRLSLLKSVIPIKMSGKYDSNT